MTWKGKDHAALQRAIKGDAGAAPKQEEKKTETKVEAKPAPKTAEKPKVVSDKGPRGEPKRYTQFNVINFVSDMSW